MRMLQPEYDEVVRKYVPGSQAGYQSERGSPEQAVMARLLMEQAMEDGTPLYRGYLDMTQFFASIVIAVQREVEYIAGV